MLSLLLLVGAFVATDSPKPNVKWDHEVQEISRKYEHEMYPTGTVNAWWASPETNKKSGLLLPGYRRQYKHMHAMVVAAFYAKRKDHRDAGMQWLRSYECENSIACKDFKQFYEGALKANILTMKKPADRDAAEKMREKIAEREREFTMPATGLCGAASERAAWLELEYQLSCPLQKDTQDFKFKLENDSKQLILSSSRLDALEHKGPLDCSAPWTTILQCNEGKKFELHCERKTDSYTGEVECKSVK